MKKGKQILSLLLVVCIIAGLSYNLVFAAPAVGEPSGGKRKVTFQYDNATATSVYVAGNFNSWNGNDPDWQMQKNSSGIWELSKDMKENTYYYKFVVDGNWINDPTNNFFIDDGSDNKNNRLVVPGDVTSPVVCGSSVTINFPVAEVPVGTTGVTVKGEFNGWAEENMTKSDDGLHYTCTINDLDPGTYEYGINMHTNEGEKYYRDFYNMETNGNGSNSVFTVNGCTVSFNANGGSGSMPDISNIAGDYELPNNTFAAPTDKRFKGWSDISGGSGRIYSPGSNYYVTKDTTLYAIWEDDPASLKHTIYFNANGGTGTMANADVTAGNYQLPSNGFTAPPGKKFKAWAEGSEFGPQYDVGYRYDVNKNTTFYAIWEDITHTVSFDSNGGSGDMPDETVKV